MIELKEVEFEKETYNWEEFTTPTSESFELTENLAKAEERILDSQYRKKSDGIYYRLELLTSANKDEFVVFDDEYARDNQQVYYKGKIVPGADAISFKVFKNKEYAIDNNNAYFGDSVIEGALVNSFEVLEQNFAKDGQDLYVAGKSFSQEGIDVPSFEFLSREYFVDKNNVYTYVNRTGTYDGIQFEIKKGADVASFEVLNKVYAKDKNKVYFVEEKAEEALNEKVDVATFEVLTNSIWSSYPHAKDKNNVYIDYFTTMSNVDLDAESFKFFGQAVLGGSNNFVATDKSNIYLCGSVLNNEYLDLSEIKAEFFINGYLQSPWMEEACLSISRDSLESANFEIYDYRLATDEFLKENPSYEKKVTNLIDEIQTKIENDCKNEMDQKATDYLIEELVSENCDDLLVLEEEFMKCAMREVHKLKKQQISSCNKKLN